MNQQTALGKTLRNLLLLIVVPMLAQAQISSFLPDYDWLGLICDPATSTLTDDAFLSICGVEKPDLAGSEEVSPPLEAESSPPETVSEPVEEEPSPAETASEPVESETEATEPATVSAPPQDPPVSLELSSSEQWIPRSGSVTITWQSTGATSCTASGDWSGIKPVDGVILVDALTDDKTYMLTCGNDTHTSVALLDVYVRQALLSWEPPTANTDGSALALEDLDGYRVYWGPSSRTYENTLEVEDPTQTSLVLELTPGTYYFSMTAISKEGEESPFSAEGHKEIN